MVKNPLRDGMGARVLRGMRAPGARRETAARRAGGFTLIELTVVVVLITAALAFTVTNFFEYQQRNTAKRAAQIFARDLSLARTAAARAREQVVIRFYETSRWYSVTTASGRELTRRRFGVGGDVVLSAISLGMPGDSLAFSRRGLADLSGLSSALGEAVFTAGSTSFRVSFNSLGASRVVED